LLQLLRVGAEPAASPPPPAEGKPTAGFTLIEVVITLAVTLAVMAIVYSLSRSVSLLHSSESHRAERGLSSLRALDETAIEVARAGFGLGADAQSLYPGLPGEPPGYEAITLRSNPDGIAGVLQGNLVARDQMVPVTNAALFRPGDRVLITDPKGGRERAEVVRSEWGSLSFRSLDGADGQFNRRFLASLGARVLKMREVRLRRRADGHGAVVLVKEEEGSGEQVLARHVQELHFEYRDDLGEVLEPSRIRPGHLAAGVGIHLRLAPEPGRPPVFVPPVNLFVALEPSSAVVGFDLPQPGFRLRRVFYRIDSAVGVASRPFGESGFILAVAPTGKNWLYAFRKQRLIRDARIDTVVALASVAGGVNLFFAPEEGPWAGFLYVVTGQLRRTQVWRIAPDSYEAIGPSSAVELLADTSELTELGGAAFGIDGALYLSDPSQGAVFRYLPGALDPLNGRPQSAFLVRGRPGPLALGDNGSLYVLTDDPEATESGRTVVWELPFDGASAPLLPRRIARLAGEGRSLAVDPLTGSLYVLMRDGRGDSVLVELSRLWLRRPEGLPREAFRLSAYKKQIESTFPTLGEVRIHPSLFPPFLDFVAFDAAGSLYLGASKTSIVVQAELERPGGVSFHRVGLAGIVGQDPHSDKKVVRLNAWKKTVFGF